MTHYKVTLNVPLFDAVSTNVEYEVDCSSGLAAVAEAIGKFKEEKAKFLSSRAIRGLEFICDLEGLRVVLVENFEGDCQFAEGFSIGEYSHMLK